MPQSKVAGVVVGLLLAGGQSRRMAPVFPGVIGGDKGLLKLAGRPMLTHVIDRMRPQVLRLVLNANGDPLRFAEFGLPVVPDTIEGFAGPLAGILAGLKWTAVNVPGAQYVASVSTDAPFLPGDLVSRLSAALSEWPRSVAVASSDGELHPVIGLWPVALAADLEGALAEGVRKVLHFTDRHGTIPVEFPFVESHGRKIDPFFNANTPDELAEARSLIEP